MSFNKHKLKEFIERYCQSDRGKAKDFDDFVNCLRQEAGI